MKLQPGNKEDKNNEENLLFVCYGTFNQLLLPKCLLSLCLNIDKIKGNIKYFSFFFSLGEVTICWTSIFIHCNIKVSQVELDG